MAESNKDVRSQILVIPATSSRNGAQQAKGIIDLIRADENAQAERASTTTAETWSSLSIFPWHISNRYYEADVQFKIADDDVTQLVRGAKQTPKRNVQRPKARIRSNANAELEDTLVGEDAEALDKKALDVFAALELGKAPSQSAKGSTSSSTEHAQTIATQVTQAALVRAQLSNVQAVLILVDRDQPPSEHEKLLGRISESDSKSPLLSAFDLAVSLVVALPTLTHDASEPTRLTSIVHADRVEDMYAEQGWEYVDLVKADIFAGEVEQDGVDDSFDGVDLEEEEQESHGVERIREALMMHTWPGLRRKADRRNESSRAEQNIRAEPLHAEQQTVVEDLSDLRLQLDALDQSGSAQPTAKDEELARAFLAQIEASQLAKNATATEDKKGISSAQLPSNRTHMDMQVALEKFLEDEDSLWPANSSASANDLEVKQKVDWPESNDSREDKSNSTSGLAAFDDDFSEFVQANSMAIGPSDRLTERNVALTAANSIATAAEPTDSFDNDELAFIGDDDDALLIQSLQKRQLERGQSGTDHGDEKEVNLDFEVTLQAVLAHAERVRAIPDHEQRREEAARVALALIDQ